MPLGDRLRRHPRKRLVRSGETFTSDELDRGDVELELPAPTLNPPPDEEQAEPWGWRDKTLPPRMRDRLAAYEAFLRERGEADPDYAVTE
jgi:hypothetical protein